jgi:3-oxoacyl-[acyl-carrier protein] reductase
LEIPLDEIESLTKAPSAWWSEELVMTNEFHKRVALITGGSRGIGRATALRLAGEGADIAFSYASRAGAAEETAAAIRTLGRRVVYRPCNVANPDEVQHLVDAARQLGPIDFLVHCGAISNLQDHSTLSLELWRETIEVNLTGTYLAVFAVKDEMIARRFGRIVTLSSVAALRPRKMQIHYASAKAGVIALTRCCAEAFAPHNVRINCLAPGLIDTEMARVLSPEARQAVVEQTPLGRLGTPEEMAAVIRFLLSEESSFMTGHTLAASGGRIMLP